MLKNDNRLCLYLVSDSSGETVFAAAKAVASQFKSLAITEYMWPLVRDQKHIDQLIADIKKKMSKWGWSRFDPKRQIVKRELI